MSRCWVDWMNHPGYFNTQWTYRSKEVWAFTLASKRLKIWPDKTICYSEKCLTVESQIAWYFKLSWGHLGPAIYLDPIIANMNPFMFISFLGKNKKAYFPIRVDSKVLPYNYFHFVLHFPFIKWDIKGGSNLSYCDLIMKKTPIVKLSCLPHSYRSYCSCRMLLPLYLLQRWIITSGNLCEVVFFRWIKEKSMKKINEMQT